MTTTFTASRKRHYGERGSADHINRKKLALHRLVRRIDDPYSASRHHLVSTSPSSLPVDYRDGHREPAAGSLMFSGARKKRRSISMVTRHGRRRTG